MKKEEYLRILAMYPPCKEEVLGEKVWTPSMAAKAIGMKSRNTVLNWARKTVACEMDMPMLGGRINGSLVHIPIRRFLDWYCYVGHN